MDGDAVRIELARTGYRFDMRLEDGRVCAVRLMARRSLAATTQLAGRTTEEALAIAPRLYALCPLAQEIALARAIEAARCAPVSPEIEAARELLLRAELVGAHALTLLAIWPLRLGLQPVTAPLAAALAVTRALAAEAFAGGPAARFLAPGAAALGAAEARLREVAAWAASAAMRLPLPAADPGRTPGPLLARRPAAWFAQRLDEAGFSATPTDDGQPGEPGAIARQGGADGSGGAAKLWRDGALNAARLRARCEELEAIAGGADPIASGESWRLGDAAACVVETARGPLSTKVQVGDGMLRACVQVAPTEWLLHPEGPLVRSLVGLRADATLAARAGETLSALDPCCPCVLEHAAGRIVEHG